MLYGDQSFFYNTEGKFECEFNYKTIIDQENYLRPVSSYTTENKEMPHSIDLPTTFGYVPQFEHNFKEHFNDATSWPINTCANCTLNDSNLSCQCIYDNVLASKSSLYLNETIGNKNGELTYGSSNFNKSCLSCMYSNNNMTCSCLNKQNLYSDTIIDLNKYIYNSNGVLQYKN